MSENSAEITKIINKPNQPSRIARFREWIGNNLPGAREARKREEERLRKEEMEAETTRRMSIWIEKGVDLIKKGEYRPSIEHFADRFRAIEYGFDLVTEFLPVFNQGKDPANPNYQESFIKNMFERSDLAYPNIINPNKSRFFYEPKYKESIFPEAVLHNASLLAAKEWVTYLFKRQGVEESQIDIVEFLEKKGVPLTNEFRAYYEKQPQTPSPNIVRQPKAQIKPVSIPSPLVTQKV